MARSTVHTSAKAQKSTFVITDRYQPPKKNQNVFIYIHEQLILMLKNALSCNFKKVRKKNPIHIPLSRFAPKVYGVQSGSRPLPPYVPWKSVLPFLCNPADRPTNQPYLPDGDNHRKKTDNIARTVTTRDWTFCGASSPSTQFLAMPASNASWLAIWSVRVPYVQTIVHRINPCDFVDHSTFMSPWTL